MNSKNLARSFRIRVLPTTTCCLTSAVALRARPLHDGTCQDSTVAQACNTLRVERNSFAAYVLKRSDTTQGPTSGPGANHTCSEPHFAPLFSPLPLPNDFFLVLSFRVGLLFRTPNKLLCISDFTSCFHVYCLVNPSPTSDSGATPHSAQADQTKDFLVLSFRVGLLFRTPNKLLCISDFTSCFHVYCLVNPSPTSDSGATPHSAQAAQTKDFLVLSFRVGLLFRTPNKLLCISDFTSCFHVYCLVNPSPTSDSGATPHSAQAAQTKDSASSLSRSLPDLATELSLGAGSRKCVTTDTHQ